MLRVDRGDATEPLDQFPRPHFGVLANEIGGDLRGVETGEPNAAPVQNAAEFSQALPL